MTIVPNQPFLDQGNRYEPGVAYDVEPSRATYFAAQGWITGSESNGHKEVTLSIDSAGHGHEARF